VAHDTVDHRTRVGRARRSRTEARILDAALRVFAEKGPDAPVVDDFVRAAGISRGTFYNHYDGVGRLLDATSVWTTGAAVASIERALQGIDDRAVRFGTGIRLFLEKARADPVWARFVARAWKLGPLDAAVRDLEEGLALGVFRFPGVEVALDVVLGALREALFQLGAGRTPDAYVSQVVRLCLQALGVAPARIARALRAEPPGLASGHAGDGGAGRSRRGAAPRARPRVRKKGSRR
jgi:AcrR family transcriptional regulator